MTIRQSPNRPTISNVVTVQQYGGQTTTAKNGPRVYVCDKISDGVNNARWRAAIANGEDATSPYSLSFSSVESDWVDWQWTYVYRINPNVKRYGRHVGTPIVSADVFPSLPSVPAYDSIRGACVAKFYSEAAEKISGFKGLVFLGEWRETQHLILDKLLYAARLLRDLWRSIRRSGRSFSRFYAGLRRRREKKRAKRDRLSWLANAYLEFTFAIEPLIHDIEAAAEVLCGEREAVIPLESFVREKKSTETVATRKYFLVNPISAVESTQTRTHVKAKAVGKIDVTKQAIRNPLGGTATALGFSTREILPALWELTPFSFLVDYFINVQDLLTTAMYADLKFVYAAVSTKARADRIVSVSNFTVIDETTAIKTLAHNMQFSVVKLSSFSFHREAITPVLARPHIALPPLGRKWLNMVALAIQKLKFDVQFPQRQ